jgi:hypothetical protein
MLGSIIRRAARCKTPCARLEQGEPDLSIRLRPLLLLLVAALAASAVAACGGGGEQATSSTDVNQLLKDTFSKGSPKSGKLHLALRIDSAGTGAVAGPVTATLDGPFESTGSGRLPKFEMDAALRLAQQNIKAGATSTGDHGFLSFQGQDYAVTDQVFKQFQASYEQAQKQAKANGSKGSLATLGIDPSKWLKNPRNEGDAKVGDTDTIKITGDVDVNRMLDDLSKATSQARALGLQGFQNLPSQLTPAQRKQAAKEIKNLKTELYVGKDDSLMRRMHVLIGLQNQQSKGTGNLDFDLSFTDVNQDQSIEAPSNPQPFNDLLGQIQQLAGQAGSSGSSATGGSSASREDLQKYTDCVRRAGTDTAKAQKCADLLKQP